jgi:hypothetical protein
MSSPKETKVQASMIIEVLGRPPEHLTATLENFAKQISEEKGVKVVHKKIMDPNLIKDQDLYTTFMEIEVETDTPMHLAGLMFKYMPAHIEVIAPENLVVNNNSFGEILSEIVRRLHRYDDIVRIIDSQNVALQNKIKELESKSTEQKVQEPSTKPTEEKKKSVKEIKPKKVSKKK